MARPNNIAQVTERHMAVATFEMDELATKPALMKAYVAMVEAAEKAGGGAQKKWVNTIEVRIAKSIEQVQDQLQTDMRRWDSQMERYKQAARGEFIASYLRSDVAELAKAENLPEPEFLEAEDVEV